jgi:hypothetical protein
MDQPTKKGRCGLGHIKRALKAHYILPGYHAVLDAERLFMRFPDMATPPPALATGCDNLCLNHPSRVPLPTRETLDRHLRIVCCFYPSCDSICLQKWKGPDPMSPSTCTEDVFLYLSATHILEKPDWADIRLCILDNEVDEMVAVYPFFLPRTESMLGSLPRVRELVQDVIASVDVKKFHFQLSIRPRKQEAPDYLNARTMLSSNIRPMVPVLPLDPDLFVENIVGGYGRY